MSLAPLFATGKDNWGTPDDLFAVWHGAYSFILDAAADETNHKVPRWFGPDGEHEDALSVAWPLDIGNVWLNPPYSRGLQSKFVRKAWQEVQGKRYHVVCLLPARTDTKLFHDVIQPHATEIRFLRGRVKFLDPMKQVNNSAPFPSMIVIF